MDRAKLISIIDVYELHTRTCDLSRYGTRERHFYPSNRQAVSLSAIRTETCISIDRGAFRARVNSRSVQVCFGGVQRHMITMLILQGNMVVHRSRAQEFPNSNAFKSSQTVLKPRSHSGRLCWNFYVHCSIYKSYKSILAKLLSRRVNVCNNSHMSISILCADAPSRQGRMLFFLQHSVSNTSAAHVGLSSNSCGVELKPVCCHIGATKF